LQRVRLYQQSLDLDAIDQLAQSSISPPASVT